MLAPTHPGWGGTQRPKSLTGVGALTGIYLQLLAQSNLRDNVVVGSSFGGWVASRLALNDTDSRVAPWCPLTRSALRYPASHPACPVPHD